MSSAQIGQFVYTDLMGDLLTSAAAAKRLGVGVSAVKRWADAGELECVRTAGGHRRFAAFTVEAFRTRQSQAERGDRWEPWISALLAPAGINALMALLFDARATRESWHGVSTIVGELLSELGERWASGRLTVADEHAASAGLTRALAAIAETIPVGRAARRCLLASAEGDEHTLGLSLAELCLREAGWAPLWLGARTPTAQVVERVGRGDVQMVALSASVWSRDRRTLARQARLVGEACRRAQIPLVLGGRGAWPDSSPSATRLYSWDDFQRFIGSTVQRTNVSVDTRT